MEDRLETTYDVIVVGTGVTEAVVAAALARSGKKVLHIDSLPYYGEPYSTHSLPAFRNWLCKLSCDGDACVSDERSSAPIDEEAVEMARRVAEWQDFEVDELGRPVVHDGVARGRSPKVTAEPAASCPKIYRNVSFEEALPPFAMKLKSSSSSSGDTAGARDDGGGHMHEAHDALPSKMSAEVAEEEEVVEGFEALVSGNSGSRYNIDVAPKIHLSRGALITALLKSGVGRYLEFMPLKYTYLHERVEKAACGGGGGALQRVPMSKADIFQATTLSPIEKRILMKFMQWSVLQGGVAEAGTGAWAIQGVGASEMEQLGFQRAVGHVGAAASAPPTAPTTHTAQGSAGLAGRTISEVMREHKLTEKLQRFVVYGIVMGTTATPAALAVERINAYVQSLGRYSDSAFLWSYYGTSEIPQAFCRMCAVYGGTYVLHRAPTHFLFTHHAANGGGSRAAGIICSRGQILRAPYVICSSGYVNKTPVLDTPHPHAAHAAHGEESCLREDGGGENAPAGVSRCVCVTSGAVVDAEGLCLALLPPHSCGNSVGIRVLQADQTAQACPPGKYLWYLSADQPGHHDLRPAVALLRQLAPTVAVHWVAYYSQMSSRVSSPHLSSPSLAGSKSEVGEDAGCGVVEAQQGFWVVSPASPDLDSGDAIGAAQHLFHAIMGPHADFLEAMPEPELVEAEAEAEQGALQPILDIFQPKQERSSRSDWSVKLAHVTLAVDASGHVLVSIAAAAAARRA